MEMKSETQWQRQMETKTKKTRKTFVFCLLIDFPQQNSNALTTEVLLVILRNFSLRQVFSSCCSVEWFWSLFFRSGDRQRQRSCHFWQGLKRRGREGNLLDVFCIIIVHVMPFISYFTHTSPLMVKIKLSLLLLLLLSVYLIAVLNLTALKSCQVRKKYYSSITELCRVTKHAPRTRLTTRMNSPPLQEGTSSSTGLLSTTISTIDHYHSTEPTTTPQLFM